MSCSNPIYALRLGIQDNGKQKIKVLPKRADLYSREALYQHYGSKDLLCLPCGKCLSCILARAHTWAVRCCLEAKAYDYNYFVTLTYDDFHYRDNGHLVKKDFQDFIKRLRYYYPGVRYFACCERGETTHRLHIHVLLFNLPLRDLKLVGRRSVGYLWKSQELLDIWNNGLIDVAEVSYSSAKYVARYNQKKLFNECSKDDEWLLMSLKPGIGEIYFQEHFSDIYKTDMIYFNFGHTNVARPPRYFDKLLERIHPDDFEEIKNKRLSDVSVSQFDTIIRNRLERYEDLFKLQENKVIENFKKLKKRGL